MRISYLRPINTQVYVVSNNKIYLYKYSHVILFVLFISVFILDFKFIYFDLPK